MVSLINEETTKIIVEVVNKKQIEAVSDYVHNMWAKWFLHFIKNMWNPFNIIRWYKQSKTTYNNLSEEDKIKDRKFAYDIVNIVRKVDYDIKVKRKLKDDGNKCTTEKMC